MDKSGPFLNLPNLLTLSRLLLAPWIVIAILDGSHVTALLIFCAAAFTDYLDGAAARRLGVVTPAGAYLDPIADKCLMSGVFIALAVARIVPLWLVVVIFGRDLMILAGVGLVLWLTPVRRFPPSVWGKLSTFVQILTAVVWLARDALQLPSLDTLASIMLWPCAGFTVWSGLDYAWRGLRIAQMD